MAHHECKIGGHQTHMYQYMNHREKTKKRTFLAQTNQENDTMHHPKHIKISQLSNNQIHNDQTKIKKDNFLLQINNLIGVLDTVLYSSK